MIYIPPTVTTDLVLFSFDKDNDLSVLLIKRANEPFKEVLALPGGYVGQGETTFNALTKKIKEKTGIDVIKFNYVEQLYTFDTVSRDPRGHAVSVTWYALCDQTSLGAFSGESPAWYKVKDLQEFSLAFDHFEIISLAHNRMKDKIWYSNIIFALLPKEFDLPTIRSMYKSIDDESEDESTDAFLIDNSVIKKVEDRYSIKIKQLVYYKK